MKYLTIGQAARIIGVGVETIRYYQRRGLIRPPARPDHGGPRDYGGATLRRLRFIRAARTLGFTLSEISELCALADDPRSGCDDIRGRAETTRRSLLERIASPREALDALETALDACPGQGDLSRCAILEAITRAGPAAREA